MDRLFALSSMASAVAQHERAASYAREALATGDGSTPYRLSRATFDRLTVTYKRLVDDRRAGIRAIDRWSSVPERPDGGNDDDDGNRCRGRSSVTEYAGRLARETVNFCRDFCAIVDRHLLPGLDRPADRAHAFKLKGDFYRSEIYFETKKRLHSRGWGHYLVHKKKNTLKMYLEKGTSPPPKMFHLTALLVDKNGNIKIVWTHYATDVGNTNVYGKVSQEKKKT